MSDIVRNIYEKIQEAKRKLSETNIKKSGRNDYSKYDYYELSDFMPQVIKIFDELKLFSKIYFTSEAAVLRIINVENTPEQEEYMLPMKDIEVKGSNAMQSLGSVTTYQRRYLYMIALDITESDSIDDKDNKDIKNAPGPQLNDHNHNKAVPEKPAPQSAPKAPKEQIDIIYCMADEISAGYKLIGKNKPSKSIIENLEKTAGPISKFTIKEASAAIDFLAKSKLKIPKPQVNPETGEVIDPSGEHDEDKFGNKLPWDNDENMNEISA